MSGDTRTAGTLTASASASARDTRESAAVTHIALPWLLAGTLLVIVAVGTGLWIRARRGRPRTP